MLFFCNFSSNSQVHLTNYSFNSGGGIELTNNSTYKQSNTFGQPIIGKFSGSNFSVTIGFWQVTSIVTSVENEEILPIEFRLYNNFPNPFNPSTTIKFDIAERGLVTLKVYDILGREISTLVNEEKDIGRYEVSFGLPYLASGIYIYRLEAGSFVNVKKMLLIK